MKLIVDNMQWIMLAGGLLTLTMLQAVFAPRATMQAMFGESIESPGADLVMRSWGALIALGGGLLAYGAFHPEWRPLILVFVGAGKLVFIGLVVAHGVGFLRRQAGVAAAVDAVMVVLFALYLLGARAM